MWGKHTGRLGTGRLAAHVIMDGQISYRWALDDLNRPTSIDQAARGTPFHCPLCKGAMIPRLGVSVQHHFAHERLTDCTPETVNRAVLQRWLAIHLNEALARRQPVTLSWACPYCGKTHSSNLLNHVARIEEAYEQPDCFIDIALLDGAGRIRGAIVIQAELTAAQEKLLINGDSFLLTLDHTATADSDDVMMMLRQGHVLSGDCPIASGMPTLLRDAAAIREQLIAQVSQFPGAFCSAVTALGNLTHVAHVGNYAILIPPARWAQIYGGGTHRIAPQVTIWIKEEPHPQGGMLYYFYITYRETHAIAVKRYGAMAQPALHLDMVQYRRDTTALDLAKYLINQ